MTVMWVSSLVGVRRGAGWGAWGRLPWAASGGRGGGGRARSGSNRATVSAAPGFGAVRSGALRKRGFDLYLMAWLSASYTVYTAYNRVMYASCVMRTRYCTVQYTEI